MSAPTMRRTAHAPTAWGRFGSADLGAGGRLGPRTVGISEAALHGGDGAIPGATSGWQLYVCCLLLVACTVPWRQKTYFSGGLDPVVAAKGLLGALSMFTAAHLARRYPAQLRIGGRTLGFLTLYLGASVIGGWAAGDLLPSAIVAVRVAMILLTIVFLLSAFGSTRTVLAVVSAMAVVAGMATVTGASTLASGRLEGAIPALPPNEIAFISGIVVLYCTHRVMERISRPSLLGVAALALAIMWLTGSRTTTVTLVLALVVMVLQARTIAVPAFLGMVAAVPIVAFIALTTGAVTDLLLRGGSQNVTTLSSRTIAWEAALSFRGTTFQQWFGGGLTMKRIPVSGQYWQEQILDSSWISALIQAGIVGLVVAAAWILAASAGAVLSTRCWRPLFTAVLVYIVPRSLLESGLFDASTAFIVLVLVSVAGEPAARSIPDESSSAPAAATDPTSHAVAPLTGGTS